jgi:hypothetical protein
MRNACDLPSPEAPDDGPRSERSPQPEGQAVSAARDDSVRLLPCLS